MRSMKRVLGSNLMSVGTRINNKPVKFEFILGKFLKNIKEKSDIFAGREIENVVMGRPVHFRDDDPKGDARAQDELKMIAQSVGYKNIEFQYEPIAAAFAHETKIPNETLACIVDIGGGTSDISIVKLGEKLQKKLDRTDDILASTGVRIGGNDFDKNLSIKLLCQNSVWEQHIVSVVYPFLRTFILVYQNGAVLTVSITTKI